MLHVVQFLLLFGAAIAISPAAVAYFRIKHRNRILRKEGQDLTRSRAEAFVGEIADVVFVSFDRIAESSSRLIGGSVIAALLEVICAAYLLFLVYPVTLLVRRRTLFSQLPRVWELFQFLLPKKIREKVYEPAHQDLLQHHLLARRYRGRWSRRWLTFAFILRTVVLFLQSVRAWVVSELIKVFPSFVRRWWT